MRHEQEAVVLEVHLMPIEKRAAPVTEPLVLKQPRTDDVVRRVRDAHGVLTSMRDGVAAAQGEDPRSTSPMLSGWQPPVLTPRMH